MDLFAETSGLTTTTPKLRTSHVQITSYELNWHPDAYDIISKYWTKFAGLSFQFSNFIYDIRELGSVYAL